MKAKLQRQKYPYASNCTDTWESTPFTEMITDFKGYDKNNEEEKELIEKRYNLPVIYEQYTQTTLMILNNINYQTSRQ